MISKRNLIPVAILAALAVPGIVSAHTATASGACTTGVQWSATNYDKTVVNTITVKVDGSVVHQDLDFKASDVGTVVTNQTMPHSWSVDIDAPGTGYDHHLSGAYQACVATTTTTTTVTPTTTTVPPATTVAPTTTQPAVTTTEPAATTTSVVAVIEPPVPPTTATPQGTVPANVTLPATGSTSGLLFGVAIGLVGVGVVLTLVARRRTV